MSVKMAGQITALVHPLEERIQARSQVLQVTGRTPLSRVV
jgi:hypothetical protein